MSVDRRWVRPFGRPVVGLPLALALTGLIVAAGGLVASAPLYLLGGASIAVATPLFGAWLFLVGLAYAWVPPALEVGL